MRFKSPIYLKVNVIDWVCKTAERVKVISEWNDVWYEVYQEIGGKSKSSGNKVCPRSAVKALWFLGLLLCSDRKYVNWSYEKIKNSKELSDHNIKNGIYSLMALEILENKQKDDLFSIKQIWVQIKEMYLKYFPDDTFPATEQGEITITYKLWYFDQIQRLIH